MRREETLSEYLKALRDIMISFVTKQEPRVSDTCIITLHTDKFISALEELYLSENKEKEEHIEYIYKTISKANHLIKREAFDFHYSDNWRVIESSIDYSFSHISELYFKETHNFYPSPRTIELDIPEGKLSIKQIALKHVYEGNQITRNNGNQIAQIHGHNSGEKLFQEYTYYTSKTNRKGKPAPFTIRKLENKITLFEDVLELLSPENQGRIKDEIAILKSFRETDD
jgi:hypothetical protein|tara:strand:+ start:126 stop:809 length:684 start_codon:yes stop_codon:yes gene_type:complete